MYFKKLFSSLVRNTLYRYTRQHKAIARCYIRHSASMGPSNFLLSDLDLTFFVKAGDIEQLKNLRKQIKADLLGNFVLRDLTRDANFLPDSDNAYQLCKEVYPYRSKYPFNTWLLADQQGPSRPITSSISLPLDHVPEDFLVSHLIPLIRGIKKPRFGEDVFLKRKLKMDHDWTNSDIKEQKFNNWHEALLLETKLWDQFYKKINFSTHQGINCRLGHFDHYPFAKRWEGISRDPNCKETIKSLWVSPRSHDDDVFNVTLNLNPNISSSVCQKGIEKLLSAFYGLRFGLFIGTEESMLARLNGLRGFCLLDPWIFKQQGVCLSGFEQLKEGIKGPSLDILKLKYREFLFYFILSTRLMENSPYSYAMYRLCFTMDHLFKSNELIMDQKELIALYGEEFIPQEKFDPVKDSAQFLSSLKEKHGFDLFGN